MSVWNSIQEQQCELESSIKSKDWVYDYENTELTSNVTFEEMDEIEETHKEYLMCK